MHRSLDRIENLNINPQKYAQKIFDKVAKVIQWKKYIAFSTNGTEIIGIHRQNMNLDLFPTLDKN